MKIVVIYNGSDKDIVDDQIRITDEETFEGAEKICNILKTKHPDTKLLLIEKEKIRQQVCSIDKQTIIFNYCEWTGKNNKYQLELLEVLEKEKYVFTGCGYEQHRKLLDKGIMKTELTRMGFVSLNYVIIDGQIQKTDLEKIKYPAIVKLTTEHCSIGLTEDSVINDTESATRKVRELYEKYQQPIMVEEFAEGNEYQVFVFKVGSEIYTLPSYETVYRSLGKPSIITFAENWHDNDDTFKDKVKSIGVVADKKKDEMLKIMTKDLFTAFGNQGYMRVDFREKHKNIFVLELNPNPSIAWTDELDFIKVCAEAMGMTHEQILDWVLLGAKKI